MIHRVFRTILAGLVIGVVLGACQPPDISNGQSAQELIEGGWVVTKYEITYDLAPDHPIDLAESSDIGYRFEDGAYSVICFPACLGVIRAEHGEYAMIEERKSFRTTTLDVELEPEYEYLRNQLIGSESRATYSFPSRDRLHLNSRVQQVYQGRFVQARVVIEAKRGG